jgi:hypothetical protein
MDEEPQHNNPVSALLTSIQEAALDSKLDPDPNEPRDVWWLRWAKFAAIILVPAMVIGAGFWCEFYAEIYREQSFNLDYQTSADAYFAAAKFRFLLGAAIGTTLGLI